MPGQQFFSAEVATDASHSAGEVVLYSGDRLLGLIKSIDENTLVIVTDFAGNIEIPRDKIAKIHTGRPVTVVFQNNEFITGEITSSNNDRMKITSAMAGDSREFQLAEVKSVVHGDPIENVRAQARVELSGKANLG